MRIPGLKSRADQKPLRENLHVADLQAARKRFYRRIRTVLWLLVFAFLASLAVRLIFRSSLFRIHDLVITGTSEMTRADAMDLLESRIFEGSKLRYALGFNNMLAWPDQIPADELKLFPQVKSVRIVKDYRTSSIEAVFEESRSVAVWCYMHDEPGQCVWIDNGGFVVGRAPEVDGNLIVHVADYASPPAAPGSRVLPAEFVPNLFSIFGVLQSSGLSVAEVRLDDLELQELTVRLATGPILYFSLRFPADAALAVLKSLKGGREIAWNSLEYVDFRVPNRAYYK